MVVGGEQACRPRILLSNDDGVGAPGLQALAAAIVAADFCDLLGAHGAPIACKDTAQLLLPTQCLGCHQSQLRGRGPQTGLA